MTKAKPKTVTAGPFRDLTDFLEDVAPIALPIGGKVYEFPGSISGATGLLLTTALDAAGSAEREGAPAVDLERVELLSDAQEKTVHAELFGGVDLELVRDGHDSRTIRHVFLTLVTWHTAGPEAAVAVWERPGNGPAPAPNRATRRRSQRASAGAGSTTPRRTSGSGTRATRQAPASSGRTSSRAGR